MPKNTIAGRLERLWGTISSTRSPAKILDYGIVAFGPEKENPLFRLTKKSLVEHRYFSVRYIALVDLFVLGGLILWALGHSSGFLIFFFFLVMAIIVFVDRREVARRAQQMKHPLKKTVKVMVEKTPKLLVKGTRVVAKVPGAIAKTPHLVKKIPQLINRK